MSTLVGTSGVCSNAEPYLRRFSCCYFTTKRSSARWIVCQHTLARTATARPRTYFKFRKLVFGLRFHCRVDLNGRWPAFLWSGCDTLWSHPTFFSLKIIVSGLEIYPQRCVLASVKSWRAQCTWQCKRTDQRNKNSLNLNY